MKKSKSFDLDFLAEKERFELSRRYNRPTPLAGAPLRPLEYFSVYSSHSAVAWDLRPLYYTQFHSPCQVLFSFFSKNVLFFTSYVFEKPLPSPVFFNFMLPNWKRFANGLTKSLKFDIIKAVYRKGNATVLPSTKDTLCSILHFPKGHRHDYSLHT